MRDIQPPAMARWKGASARMAAYQFLAGYMKANSHRAAEQGLGNDSRVLEAVSQIFQGLADMTPEHVTAEPIEKVAMRASYHIDR